MDEKVKEIETVLAVIMAVETLPDANEIKRVYIEHISFLLSHIKELEDNIPDPEWCCEKHKAGLVARIKELEEVLQTIVAQSSGIAGSTNRADCIAAIAKLALREKI